MTIWIKTPNLKYNIWSVLVLLSCNILEMSWTPQQLQVYWACRSPHTPYILRKYWRYIYILFSLKSELVTRILGSNHCAQLCDEWILSPGFFVSSLLNLAQMMGRPPAVLRRKSCGEKGWPMELSEKAHFCLKLLDYSFYNQINSGDCKALWNVRCTIQVGGRIWNIGGQVLRWKTLYLK